MISSDYTFIVGFSALYPQAPLVSYNFRDNSGDPSTGFPWHGTSCGGIIGAVKNDVCGVGIAYEVNLGGKQMITS